MAGGIGVSGGSNHSVSKTYSSQRVIAIPPHAKKYLTEGKWVKTKKGNILSDAEYERIESAEHFTVYGLHQNINKGEVKIFKENESPWERKYIITYSLEEDFSSYSTLTTEMYLREIIGCHDVLLWNSKPHENYIDGLNEYTIESYY